ncbi:hypothetical protein SLEP1_g3429 [Rubroshorea leprosula]|uniref:Uncharacterized protein n=1 Tax=Rubroshorea leprosula TaxID=152421 RepID=A0AAV5HSU1_9ROSI|nr:hypothetical protein SLEP1_g3429 [Rubroshorea leprosula]
MVWLEEGATRKKTTSKRRDEYIKKNLAPAIGRRGPPNRTVITLLINCPLICDNLYLEEQEEGESESQRGFEEIFATNLC